MKSLVRMGPLLLTVVLIAAVLPVATPALRLIRIGSGRRGRLGRGAEDWVWDSLFPGPQYVTRYYYDFVWWTPGTPLPQSIPVSAGE